MLPNAKLGVLFVCYANVCRSPLAEGIFRQLVQLQNLSHRFMIDSAGVAAIEGLDPHPYSMEVAEEHGIKLISKSRPFGREDFCYFEYILAMDRSVYNELLRLRKDPVLLPETPAQTQIRLFRTLLDPHAQGTKLDVPDPVCDTRDGFSDVFHLLARGCKNLLDELIHTHL